MNISILTLLTIDILNILLKTDSSSFLQRKTLYIVCFKVTWYFVFQLWNFQNVSNKYFEFSFEASRVPASIIISLLIHLVTWTCKAIGGTFLPCFWNWMWLRWWNVLIMKQDFVEFVLCIDFISILIKTLLLCIHINISL